MKILSVGNFTTGWDGSICDEEHIARALEQLGHEVIRCQRGQENVYVSPNRDPYDVILMSQWNGYHPDFVKNTKNTINKGKTDKPCPVVYWAFDFQWNPPEQWHLRILEDTDVYLSKEMEYMLDYHRLFPNLKIHWFSQDFGPDFLDWEQGIIPDIDVLFTGSFHPGADNRIKTLKAIDERFNLVVHSVTPEQWKEVGLKNVNGPVMDHGLPALIARAKINLSVDIFDSPGFWSDRNGQIMLCGGFVLFRYQTPAESIFGDSIGYFYGPEDAAEKVQYYLDHDEEREMIRRRGYELAHKRFKASHRVKELITILEKYVR